MRKSRNIGVDEAVTSPDTSRNIANIVIPETSLASDLTNLSVNYNGIRKSKIRCKIKPISRKNKTRKNLNLRVRTATKSKKSRKIRLRACVRNNSQCRKQKTVARRT